MTTSPNLINFFVGHPTTRLLPKKEVLQASENVLFPAEADPVNDTTYLDPQNRHPLSYGSDQGAAWVRGEIAKWTNQHFKPTAPTTSSHISLTGGASYGVLNALLQCTLAQTGYTRQAFIVTPTYFLINDCFIDAGFGGKLTAINEGDGGQLDLKYLEEQLAYHEAHSKPSEHEAKESLRVINGGDKSGWKKVYKYVFWCVPTFSNPGGLTLTEQTRIRLIEIARKYDMLIITDDVYDLLDYGTNAAQSPPLKRLDILDRETLPSDNLYGNTIANASFSKIIAPGLRVGWQTTATTQLAHQLSQGGANTSGGSPSQFNANIAGNLLRTGALSLILDRFNQAYAIRAQAVREGVKRHLPWGTRVQGGDGGYFIWVTLPEKYDCRAICRELLKRNVKLANGDNFEVAGDKARNYRDWGRSSVRLSVSWAEKEEIELGFKIWGEVCKEFEKK